MIRAKRALSPSSCRSKSKDHGTQYKNSNVLKTGPVTEAEKLSVHGSLVGPVVEPRLNR